MVIVSVILSPSLWDRWGKMYTFPLFTRRKSSIARLLSGWQAEGCVRLLNACWWIQQTYFCLFVCRLVWLSDPKIQMESNSSGKSKAAQEHMVGSAPFTSTHPPLCLRTGQVLNEFPWSIPGGGLAMCSWVHFSPRDGTETYWDTVGASFLGTHPFWELLRPRRVRIDVIHKAPKNSF